MRVILHGLVLPHRQKAWLFAAICLYCLGEFDSCFYHSMETQYGCTYLHARALFIYSVCSKNEQRRETMLASKSTYYINTIKTHYGKFNIRFPAVKIWNDLDESIKHLALKSFKNKVKFNILQSFCQHSWVFIWHLPVTYLIKMYFISSFLVTSWFIPLTYLLLSLPPYCLLTASPF